MAPEHHDEVDLIQDNQDKVNLTSLVDFLEWISRTIIDHY
jgi:hypothetical protein